ncbi:uncharacterized protein E0L32_007230 [Thyridium curvatum]|uniref:Uncharacterized protein n=1 Tax=Thyridium curvatum TaxID=1093900 RepID=A0A507AMZ6_9PEZI|nr:uncharacterized protein E0L32_007230 [Thyridium curvatum]TPX12115.1 hypothetical protein E0L32_007230 [Thyridium curvatum]
MHEIITLQFGQQSNYLATHFWNAQESYFTYSADQESPVNHDIHWRPGIGADGAETFMPRTVIYDLKGGFGSLRKINALYDVMEDKPPEALWSGQTVVQRQEPIEQSAYQQSLDAGLEAPPLSTETVRYWSDFNRVFFHPRSVVQLDEYELNSAIRPFDKRASGEELFSSLDREHDLLDRDLRPFAEEADHMQGIQIMTTIDDAWGGFMTRYLERIRDEYGKTTVWVWGLQDSLRGVPREKRLLRLANKAQTLTEAYKQASLLVPVSIPERPLPRNISLDLASRWHTSALLATAIESVTLPSRLKHAQDRDAMGTITDLLNVMGKQTVASLSMSLQPSSHDHPAAPAVSGDTHPEGAAAESLSLDIDFSPPDELPQQSSRQNGHKQARVFGQVVTSRGPVIKDEAAETTTATTTTTSEADHREEVIRRRHAQQSFSRRYRTDLGYPLPDSFPRIFLDGDAGRPLPSGASAGVTAALSTESAVCDRLRQLRGTVVRSIGLVDREGLSNDLAEMADEYHDGWSSGSDIGDDDD